MGAFFIIFYLDIYTFLSRIEAKRFIAYIENGEIRLTPLTDPKELKGTLKVAWSIEELEEEGDKYASKRT
jgi:hypothetical protein